MPAACAFAQTVGRVLEEPESLFQFSWLGMDLLAQGHAIEVTRSTVTLEPGLSKVEIHASQEILS
jgi:hypothetical protein